MARSHHYQAKLVWTGAAQGSARTYEGYSRAYEVLIPGRPVLLGSSDPAFRGDPVRHNPEDLLLAALAGCHMLWYLHLAVEAGIEVLGYVDQAAGTMAWQGGKMRFTEVVLRPEVTIAKGEPAAAAALHARAQEECFIASSVNFPVRHEPVILTSPA